MGSHVHLHEGQAGVGTTPRQQCDDPHPMKWADDWDVSLNECYSNVTG